MKGTNQTFSKSFQLLITSIILHLNMLLTDKTVDIYDNNETQNITTNIFIMSKWKIIIG